MAVYKRMVGMFEIFHIPEDKLVTGATRVQDPNSSGAVVDLAKLNPTTRGGNTAPPKHRDLLKHTQHGTYQELVHDRAAVRARRSQAPTTHGGARSPVELTEDTGWVA